MLCRLENRQVKQLPMKKTILLLLAALSAAGAFAAAPPALVPQPRLAVCDGGEGLQLADGVRISVPANNVVLFRVAEQFAQWMEREAGLRLAVAESDGPLRLTLDESLGAEAYRLTVGPDGLLVEGGTEAGVFYGLQSLRQLVSQYGTALPALRIEDEPTFAYRGTMLDCCRHFFTVDEVKTFIDILALHKINRFHWHLTDDQGWRIEILRYPELTRVGAHRAETVLGNNSAAYDGKPYGGYYTQRQVRDVVAYAAERFITVVPEIEMPGPASAALASYPWLGCAGEGYKGQTLWGVFPEVFCAGRDTTFEFMEEVLDEVIALFPSEYIHVGGDECPKENWKRCPECQRRIREEGLRDENELQSYFIHRIERWLNAHGRKLIGWDEILEGGISQSATIMSWRGAAGGIAAARAGNHAIMTPNTHCYFDYYQTKDPRQEPWGIGGYVSVGKVYALDPYDQLTEAERPFILGVQANLWTEYVAGMAHLQHMLLPRLAALAEVGWACDRRDMESFRVRLGELRRLYERCGYRCAPYFFDRTDE